MSTVQSLNHRNAQRKKERRQKLTRSVHRSVQRKEAVRRDPKKLKAMAYAYDKRTAAQLRWLQQVMPICMSTDTPSNSILIRRAITALVQRYSALIEAGRDAGSALGFTEADRKAEVEIILDHVYATPSPFAGTLVNPTTQCLMTFNEAVQYSAGRVGAGLSANAGVFTGARQQYNRETEAELYGQDEAIGEADLDDLDDTSDTTSETEG